MSARAILTILLCSAVGVGWIYAAASHHGERVWWWSALGFVVVVTAVAAVLHRNIEHGALRAALATIGAAVVAIGVVVAEGPVLGAIALGVLAGALVSRLRQERLPRVARGTMALLVGVTVFGVGAEVRREWRARADAERERIANQALPTLVVPPCGTEDEMSHTPDGHPQRTWRGVVSSFTVTRTCYGVPPHAAFLDVQGRKAAFGIGVSPDDPAHVRADPDGSVYAELWGARDDVWSARALGAGPDGKLRAWPEQVVQPIRLELLFALSLAAVAWLAAAAQRRFARRRLERLSCAVDGELADGWFTVEGARGVPVSALRGFRGAASDYFGEAFAWGIPLAEASYRGAAPPRCVAYVGRREDAARGVRFIDEMTTTAALLVGCVAAASTCLVWLA